MLCIHEDHKMGSEYPATWNSQQLRNLKMETNGHAKRKPDHHLNWKFQGVVCRVVSGKVSSYVLCTISFRLWFVEFLISITFPNNCQEPRTTRPSGKILGWVRVAGAKESARKSNTSCRNPRKKHFLNGSPKVSLVHTLWRIERL